MLEFTEIILKYSDMLHNYYAVRFEGAIQVLDTLLNMYIYYELLGKACTTLTNHCLSIHM